MFGTKLISVEKQGHEFSKLIQLYLFICHYSNTKLSNNYNTNAVNREMNATYLFCYCK